MKKSKPLVSVIIPCYNAEKFLEQAVRSIMNQTYKNLEIIVINDCSQDSTAQILQKLAQEDKRIIYIENKQNLKLSRTLNRGIEIARGEYIVRMDADDISLENRIATQIDYLISHEEIDVISAYAQIINEKNILGEVIKLPLSHHHIKNVLPMRSTFIHPLVAGRKSFFVDLGGYNNNIHYGEDYDLWIRGLLYGKKYNNISNILLYYRKHKCQMTGLVYNSKNAQSVKRFLLKYFFQTKQIGYLKGFLLQSRMYYKLSRLINGLLK